MVEHNRDIRTAQALQTDGEKDRQTLKRLRKVDSLDIIHAKYNREINNYHYLSIQKYDCLLPLCTGYRYSL